MSFLLQHGRSLWVALLGCLLTVGAVQVRADGATLRETLAAAQAAFAAGDYAAATAIFDRIESEFGREPEVQNEDFQRVVFPIRGYAALLAGDAAKAAQFLEQFVERFPQDRERMTVVLFTLARAQNEAGRLDDALATYDQFIARAPNRPEAALATLESARLLFAADRAAEALARLDALYESNAQAALRVQGRLLALQEAIRRGEAEAARVYLLETDWEVNTMPELAVLAFAALEMGQQFLESEAYTDAIRAFRLVPPRNRLIAAQEARLHDTRARFEDRRERVGFYQGGAFWTQFYTQLLGRLEGQLRGLREAEDYTTGLYLSLGQAYLLAERPREAWILFERMARDTRLSEAERAQAHYRWIISAINVGVWEDAFVIAGGFSERFPHSELVPESLYLLATAHQQSGQYRDAIRVLSALVDGYPTHPLAPRWLFVRGFNYNLINEPVEARADFAQFIQRYPNHGLILDVRMWHALTHFAERDYGSTLEELNALTPAVRGTRLEAEISYRIASTLYAKREFADALAKIEAYLRDHPYDSRADEARVLLGDIQMGMGNLRAAREVFAAISPEAGHLFVYAIFQAGKIIRAVAGSLDDADVERRERLFRDHIALFENYVDRDDVPNKTRISEALYWIGWTHLERGRPDEALAVFENALQRFGDDLDATEVPLIIDALARVDRAASPRSRVEREDAFLAWIEQQRARALEDGALTYYARLNLYLDRLLEIRSPQERPSSVLFETVERVPLDRLDAESLGRIGTLLVENYPGLAEAYIEQLEELFPESLHRVYAYFGRARLQMQDGNYRGARSLLGRFLRESPMHPLAIDATLFYAETLTRVGEHSEAEELLEDLLRRREARGRPHARALIGLSRNAESAGDLRRAVAYAQRVYTVYRAFPDLLAQAYMLNARQFEALGEPRMAYNTLVEMLADPRVQRMEEAGEARTLLQRLENQLPAAEAGGAQATNPSSGGRG